MGGPQSSERSQASDTLDGVVAVTRALAGVDGGVTSGAVLPVTGLLRADSLPAASTALTWKENSVPATRPVIVFCGGTGDPQMQ